MQKQYFIKTQDGDWQQITGKEFFLLVNSDEGRQRYFIDMGDSVLECTHEEYRAWKKDYDHAEYLYSFEQDVQVLSYEWYFENCQRNTGDVGGGFEEEVLAAMLSDSLAQAISLLSEKEMYLLENFFSDNRSTEREIASILGISQCAVNKRKKKILKKLKMWLSNPK